MYPIISSPTSPTTPQDVQMITLCSPVQADKFFSSSMKSANTIRNNMEFKNELKNQRTSLHFHENVNEETLNADSISNSSNSSAYSILTNQQAIKLATVKRHYPRSENKSSADHPPSSSNQVQSPTDNNVKNNNTTRLYSINNRNGVHESYVNHLSNSVNSNGKNQASDHVNYLENDGDIISINYNDHINGNNFHKSKQKCDSVHSKESSSAEDYFLCEKFKNTMNAKLCDSVTSDSVVLDDDHMSEKGMSMELLSPHEGPMGRRYAEITSNKNSANVMW